MVQIGSEPSSLELALGCRKIEKSVESGALGPGHSLQLGSKAPNIIIIVGGKKLVR